jgi:hypothetical protein
MSNPFPQRARRWPTNLPVLLIVDPGGVNMPTPASGFDFSLYGIGVRSHVNLARGQIVDIIPREGPTHAVRGRVVWVKPQGSSEGCEAGLEFLNLSQDRTPRENAKGPTYPQP